MECVVFIGTQACGKTSFFRERFFGTHVRINLDMLKTRHREQRFLETCLETRQPFVVDNTNPQRDDRRRYIEPAREAGFRVVGFYFNSQLAAALERNAARPEGKRVPDRGVRGTHARLELPERIEGFDELYYVTFRDRVGFTVEDWSDEI